MWNEERYWVIAYWKDGRKTGYGPFSYDGAMAKDDELHFQMGVNHTSVTLGWNPFEDQFEKIGLTVG